MNLFSTLVLVSLSVCSLSYAGTDGHGAGGFYHTITKSIELLDLVEAREDHHWPPFISDPTTVDAEIKRVLDKIDDPQFRKMIENGLTFVRNPNHQHPLGSNQGLPFPSDTSNHYECNEDSDCKAVGIVLYHDANESREIDENDYLEVNLRLIAKMQFEPATEAALWFHESVYKAYRILYNDQYSIRARRLTGCLFSDVDAKICQVDVPVLTAYVRQPAKLIFDATKGFVLDTVRKYLHTPHFFSVKVSKYLNQDKGCYDKYSPQYIDFGTTQRPFEKNFDVSFTPDGKDLVTLSTRGSNYPGKYTCDFQVEIYDGYGALIGTREFQPRVWANRNSSDLGLLFPVGQVPSGWSQTMQGDDSFLIKIMTSLK